MKLHQISSNRCRTTKELISPSNTIRFFPHTKPCHLTITLVFTLQTSTHTLELGLPVVLTYSVHKSLLLSEVILLKPSINHFLTILPVIAKINRSKTSQRGDEILKNSVQRTTSITRCLHDSNNHRQRRP